MKNLFLSAILSFGLISPIFAMENQDLKIAQNRIDFENEQYIEFSDLTGYKSSEDAKNTTNGTCIGICCHITQNYSYHIIEDKFNQESWWVNKYGTQVELLQLQPNLSRSAIEKYWQDFEILSIEDKAKLLKNLNDECKRIPPVLENIHNGTLAAINYLIGTKAYSDEYKIILFMCMKNIEIQNKCIENMQAMKHKGLPMELGLITSPIWVPIAFWRSIFTDPKGWRDFLLRKHPTCQDGLGYFLLFAGVGFTILDGFLLYELASGVKNKLKA